MKTCMGTRRGKSPNPSWRWASFLFSVLACDNKLRCAIKTSARYALRFMVPYFGEDAHLFAVQCVAALQELRDSHGPECLARIMHRIMHAKVSVCVLPPRWSHCECDLRCTLCRLVRRAPWTCDFGVRMSNFWRSWAVDLRLLRWQRRPYPWCR